MKIVNRMPLYVGKRCNAACSFCYYLTELKKENFPFNSIVKALRIYKKYGINSIDITGGEPTIHKDIIRIVETAVAMGYQDTTLISNGIALKNEQLVNNLTKAGVRTFVLSLHGHNAETHDALTGVKGSFDALLKAINHIIRIKSLFNINIVVNTHNFNYLIDFAELLTGLGAKPSGVTFLVLNSLNDSKNTFGRLTARYSELKEPLKKAIQILKEKGISTTWKFMPLCIDPEISNETNNIYQFFFNPYDWNYKVHIIYNFGYASYLYVLFKNFIAFDREQLRKIPFKFLLYMAVLNESFNGFFIKIDKCQKCKYFYVCDGVSEKYLELNGADEIKPVIGEKIVNPAAVVNKNAQATWLDRILNRSFFIISKVMFYLVSLIFHKKIAYHYTTSRAPANTAVNSNY